jgi:aspartyl-tRNA(Asn)/glutamyl-tRNA(Gln) amidotransferase subunit A
MSDLHTLSLSEASTLIRDRKLSPVEYTRALVEHTEGHDGKLNAFLRFTPEIALAWSCYLIWLDLANLC